VSVAPDVAVVVPTRDRAERLRALLASLARQDGVDFEVVVVDDGSRDHTPDVIRTGAPGLRLRSVRLDPSRGVAAARNAGWRATGAPLVAFTDDDCTADAGWLAALLEANRSAPDALLQGRTEPNPAEVHRQNAFSRSHLLLDLGYFKACNIAYPREVLERHAGFDEGFSHYAEDADLAWRAREDGTPAVFVDGALVYHAVREMGVVGLLRDSQRWADAVRAFARHPGAREGFRHAIFWKPSHERILGLAAGIALARRTRGLSLSLAAPYVALYRSRHGSWAGTLAALPGHAAIDVAEVVAMVRGSWRFRTLVL
jgi:glycosyltransferase involved in cell wall biosynthesis